MKQLKRLFQLGVNDNDDFFEKKLKIAINLLSFNAVISLVFAAVFGFLVQENPTSVYILIALPFFIFSIYLNTINKSLLAISLLFISSALLLGFYSLRTGEESYTHVHFVLNIIGLALLFKKEKAKNYLIFNLIFTLACLAFVLLSYQMNWFEQLIDPTIIPSFQRKLNFYLLIVGSLFFSMVVINSYAMHNRILEIALNEQKVLLAEVNHRVKNNMAVIISLLNLKRNVAASKETEDSLNEVKDRVMSMAIVHQQIYDDKNKASINIEKYVVELLQEIKNSLFHDPEVKMTVKVDEVCVDASLAIPIGLILNELITNSMKHAFKGVLEPEITVICKKDSHGNIEIIVRDNGQGLPEHHVAQNGKLGMILIESLCEQVDGVYSFSNDNGLVFSLKIPQ